MNLGFYKKFVFGLFFLKLSADRDFWTKSRSESIAHRSINWFTVRTTLVSDQLSNIPKSNYAVFRQSDRWSSLNYRAVDDLLAPSAFVNFVHILLESSASVDYHDTDESASVRLHPSNTAAFLKRTLRLLWLIRIAQNPCKAIKLTILGIRKFTLDIEFTNWL